jgi:dTDP-4-amino-4,6-dideoxygalactose transaminase
LQPLASRFEIQTVGNLRNSEYLWEMGLYLPSGIGTTDLEIDQVVEILWSLVEK